MPALLRHLKVKRNMLLFSRISCISYNRTVLQCITQFECQDVDTNYYFMHMVHTHKYYLCYPLGVQKYAKYFLSQCQLTKPLFDFLIGRRPEESKVGTLSFQVFCLTSGASIDSNTPFQIVNLETEQTFSIPLASSILTSHQ